MSLKFCIIIEPSSRKNIFAIVRYINITAVTSHQSRELVKYLPDPILFSLFFCLSHLSGIKDKFP